MSSGGQCAKYFRKGEILRWSLAPGHFNFGRFFQLTVEDEVLFGL